MPAPIMKCKSCKQEAQYRFPSHNARFCHACLEKFVRRQVEKAIKDYDMLAPGQRVLVAVSGGKDSLALWQVLNDLGYQTEGLHLGLDIEDAAFSGASLAACQAMAQRLNRPLHLKSLRRLLGGLTVQQVVWANKRDFCAVCGGLKRHFMNRLARELDAPAVASGHHLGDEAARLLGNLIRHHTEYLERQWPTLPATAGGMAKKVKPLCRLAADEIKAYAESLRLPYLSQGCPNSKGATLTFYKEAMELLETRMPGTRRNLYFSFLRRAGQPPAASDPPMVCTDCGQPTFVTTCTTCRMLRRARERFGDEPQES